MLARFPHLLIAVVFGALAATGLPQAAEPGPPAEDAPRGPLHRIRLPGNPILYDAVFSPDGQTLYVRTDGAAINLWALLVYHWPEVLGGFTALTVLVCGIALWRIAARKRIVGEPHCRHCNYCLKGLSGERCPECGQPNQRPIVGRPMMRRCAPFAVPLGMVVLGYGALWAIQAPRSGYVSSWRTWWSYDLEERAADWGISLVHVVQPTQRVLELDVQSGSVRKTLFTRALTTSPFFALTGTVDGRGLILPVGTDRLELISARSGRTIRSLSYPVNLPQTRSHWHQFAGFSDDGETAYLVALEEKESLTALLSWNLRTSACEVLLKRPCDMCDDRPWPREFYKIPGGGMRLLELPSRMAPYDDPVTIFVCDAAGPNGLSEPKVEFEAAIWGHTTPGFSSDGRRVYLSSRTLFSALDVFDLRSGERLTFVGPPRSTHLGFGNSSSNSPRRLVCAGTFRPGGIRVRAIFDVDGGRWLCSLAVPSEILAMESYTSPDGRFVAANGFIHARLPNGSFQHELLIYEVDAKPVE